jgi:hypothetical protein
VKNVFVRSHIKHCWICYNAFKTTFVDNVSYDFKTLKGTLNEGSKEKVQQNGSTLLVESPKLEPRPLDEDPNPIQANLSWQLHGIILEGNSNDLDQKMKLKKKFMVWKTKM